MCDQDNNHFTHSASISEDKNDKFRTNPDNEFNLVTQGLQLLKLLPSRSGPIPYVPRTGEWLIADWASFLDETEEALKRKFKEYNYQPIRFGNTIWVDAVEFWRCLKQGSQH